jgi:hypothetical protein
MPSSGPIDHPISIAPHFSLSSHVRTGKQIIMRRHILALTLALAGLAPCGQAYAGSKPVYKVDTVSAVIDRHRLVIKATGAVTSGGWLSPKLHVEPQRVPEANTLVVDFVATPPQHRAMVIQALLPVQASVTTGLPHYGTIQVKVVGETNSVVAQIISVPTTRSAELKAVAPRR